MIKKVEKNNLTIAFLYARKKIYPALVWKHNSNREKQVILLMSPNGDGCHYLEVQKLPALSIGITSKNKSDFYFLNCLHSFRIRNKLESHKKVCENKDFCNIVMPSADTKILDFN